MAGGWLLTEKAMVTKDNCRRCTDGPIVSFPLPLVLKNHVQLLGITEAFCPGHATG
jgi:hypothetical protein